MPLTDIEDKAKAHCRLIFPDNEEKQKECVPVAMAILQPKSTKASTNDNKQPIQTEQTDQPEEKEEEQ